MTRALRRLLRRAFLLVGLLVTFALGAMLAVGRESPEWAPDALIDLGHDTRLLLRPALSAIASLANGSPGDRRLFLADRGEALVINRDGLRIGATLHRRLAGPARETALVIVHGSTPFARRLGMYGALAHRLQGEGFDVLRMDQFGYGDSADPDDPALASNYRSTEAVCVAAGYIADIAGARRVAVVGHSLGADVALGAAREYGCMDSLVAIGPARRFVERAGTAQAPELRYQARRERRHMRLDTLPTETFLATRGRLSLERHMPWLAAPGHLPVLFVDGGLEATEDLAFLREACARMAPPVECVTLADADHYANTTGLGRLIVEDTRAMQALGDAIAGWVDSPAGSTP